MRVTREQAVRTRERILDAARGSAVVRIVQAPISHALLAAGVVDRSEEGFAFPFDAIRVEFTLQAAA